MRKGVLQRMIDDILQELYWLLQILCEIITVRLKHVPVETRYCTEIPWRGVIVRWHPDCALMALQVLRHTAHTTQDVYVLVGYGIAYSFFHLEHGFFLSSVFI